MTAFQTRCQHRTCHNLLKLRRNRSYCSRRCQRDKGRSNAAGPGTPAGILTNRLVRCLSIEEVAYLANRTPAEVLDVLRAHHVDTTVEPDPAIPIRLLQALADVV